MFGLSQLISAPIGLLAKVSLQRSRWGAGWLTSRCPLRTARIPWRAGSTILLLTLFLQALPRRPSGKEATCLCRRCKRGGFDPWVRKILWSRKWQPTPEFLPGESHGQRGLVGHSPWGHKSQTRHVSAVKVKLPEPHFFVCSTGLK